MKILIINGPNLNLQGRRDTGVYGSQTFESYFEALKANYPSVEFGYFQSNIEGELIDAVQQADGVYDGVVLSVGRVGSRRRGAHLLDPRPRGVPPHLAAGSRGRGVDHGVRPELLSAGRVRAADRRGKIVASGRKPGNAAFKSSPGRDSGWTDL